jgi:hypothetical protein
VLFCSTLYPASCTVEVSRLILSVLGCTLVTRSTKPSHVPLIFGQLSNTLISDNNRTTTPKPSPPTATGQPIRGLLRTAAYVVLSYRKQP